MRKDWKLIIFIGINQHKLLCTKYVSSKFTLCECFEKLQY